MTVLEMVPHFQTVWRIALPHIAEPTPEDVVRWCSYPVASVEQAILRTSKRFSKEKVAQGFDVGSAYRYTTSTARRMAAESQQ